MNVTTPAYRAVRTLEETLHSIGREAIDDLRLYALRGRRRGEPNPAAAPRAAR